MEPFLRIPPFPRHRARPLASAQTTVAIGDQQADELVALLGRERVGGTFWAPKTPLPPGRNILLSPADDKQLQDMVAAAAAEGVSDRCVVVAVPGGGSQRGNLPLVRQPGDPWYLAASAEQVWADADHEIALVAALCGTHLRSFGQGIFGDLPTDADALRAVVAKRIGSLAYASPFDGSRMNAFDAVRLLGEWRRLIDGNQMIDAALGIAAWKRTTVDTLLWDGSAGPNYASRLPPAIKGRLAVWKSRTTPALLQQIERSGLPVTEIEDGLIRGHGLGANCVPPLSIVLDSAGIYFDPALPSDLEILLQSAEFDADMLRRAEKLRHRIAEVGVSKYGGRVEERTRPSSQRRVLVVGQVEDDRSILSGGGGQTNLELLRQARVMEPDAWLIYRPHPDVEAGHRKGYLPHQTALRFADEIDRGGSIVGLIESVDEIHCITSLAGFEALLRAKRVTAHGVPFYAGWGLTRDLGPIPERRTRRRSLDELIAASIILYPRYLDPVTGLPCPAEVLVERIALGEERIAAPLAGVRKMQGRLKRAVRRLREAVG